jgi:hypothetical protein
MRTQCQHFGMGQLDDAAKAYRSAVAGLTETQESAAGRIKAARERVAAKRADLAVAIVAEAEAGIPQVEIIRRTGYSRERVRTILREGGVEPD